MDNNALYLLLHCVLALASSSSVLEKYTKTRDGSYHGRYTRDVQEPAFLVPRHVSNDGKFLTYELPKYYNHREMNERRKRSLMYEAETVHLMLPLNDVDHHVELTPYHEFISPHMVIESRGPGIEKSLNEGLRFSRAADQQCHYRGHIRGHSNSRAALSLCDGVAGYIQTKEGRYFIEPAVDSEPATDGQHVHMAYRRQAPHETGGPGGDAPKRFCGTSGPQPVELLISKVDQSAARSGLRPRNAHRSVRDADWSTSMTNNSTGSGRIEKLGNTDNWEAAWAEQLAKRQQLLVGRAETQTANGPTSSGPSKRDGGNSNSATHSIHRYVELGLVCDRRFLDYHKNTDYEKYLLTIGNMVSDYWHDASCGNQVDIVIVRMVYLEAEKKEIDLNISPESDKTLASFAAWAEKMNPTDVNHPNHFDIGALITRYDICSETSSCDLMGLAFVAAACDPSKAACINEDGGLVLGIVVAHEIGHVLGCSHDQVEDSGCPPQDKDGSYFVMSPIVSPHTFRWSTCSRKFITSYLESGLGDCLNNNPRNPPEKYKFDKVLPGVVYDGSAQCNYQRLGTTFCETAKGTMCESLWCKNGTSGCFSEGHPPAEGTKCGEKEWCIGQKCVAMGSRPGAVNGGWSEWGAQSKCSRTCGVGVKATERECNKPPPSNGGKFCLGERKRYETCNLTACDPAQPPFRAAQCAEYSQKPMLADRKGHKWEPFFSDTEPCALYCVNEENVILKLSPVAKDGTPCKAGTKNLCIAGVCRRIGCDWVIDSETVEDRCGVCKGDGTQCSAIEGTFTKNKLQGYQKVVTIPKGARTITVSEKGESSNTIAIKYEKSDKYCLNGDLIEQRDGNYDCAGAILIYSHPFADREEITIAGPINEDIQVQYTFFDPKINPGIYYKYHVKTGGATGYTPKYSWDFTEWGECTAKCGGGTSISKPSCIEEKSGLVSPDYCQSIPRPDPKSRICNQEPCKTIWRVSQWSKCNACDGKTGVRQRKVLCIKRGSHPGDEDVEASFETCKNAPPKQEISCVGDRPCKKVCSKKSRDCGDTQIAIIDPKERQRMLTEQRRMIDNMVDLGLARYLEKNRRQTANEISKKTLKRDTTGDFRRILRDWLAIGGDGKEKRTCRKSPKAMSLSGFTKQSGAPDNAEGQRESSRKVATIKPGSIIKDVIPPNEIVLYAAPIRAESFKANVSDAAFQESGDSIPIGIDTRKGKVFHGLDAINVVIGKQNGTGKN